MNDPRNTSIPVVIHDNPFSITPLLDIDDDEWPSYDDLDDWTVYDDGDLDDNDEDESGDIKW